MINDDHIHRTGPRDFYWHRLQEVRCVYCENTALRNALESKINQVDDLLVERLNSRALMDRAAKAEAGRDALKQETEKLLEALRYVAATASSAYRARRC